MIARRLYLSALVILVVFGVGAVVASVVAFVHDRRVTEDDQACLQRRVAIVGDSFVPDVPGPDAGADQGFVPDPLQPAEVARLRELEAKLDMPRGGLTDPEAVEYNALDAKREATMTEVGALEMEAATAEMEISKANAGLDVARKKTAAPAVLDLAITKALTAMSAVQLRQNRLFAREIARAKAKTREKEAATMPSDDELTPDIPNPSARLAELREGQTLSDKEMNDLERLTWLEGSLLKTCHVSLLTGRSSRVWFNAEPVSIALSFLAFVPALALWLGARWLRWLLGAAPAQP